VLLLVALGMYLVARAFDMDGCALFCAAGAAFVAAAAGQPQAFVFVPGAVPAALARGPRTRRLGALVLGAALAFLGFSWVQERASGHWVGLSAGAGVNFYIGNHAGAEGGFDLPPESGLVNTSFGLYPSARAAAIAAWGDTALGPAAVSRYWTGKTLAWVAGNPAAAVALFGNKMLLAVNSYEVPNHYPLAYFAAKSPVLAWTPVRFVWLGSLGLAGIAALLARRTRGGAWLGLTAALVLLVLALFFVTDRYRLLLWPVVAHGAAAGLEAIVAAVKARDGHALAALAATIGLLVLVSAAGPHPEFGRAEIHLIKSTVLATSGDAAGARSELETAASYRESAAASHNLGNAYYREGRYAEAATEYRQALSLEPRSAPSLLGLGLAELELGRRAEAERVLGAAAALAPDDARVTAALARARGDSIPLRTARPPEVAALFSRALAAARAGKRDSARAGFTRVLALAPGDGAAHLNLGLLAEQDGDLATAERELAAAAAAPRGSDHLELLLARGRIAARRGDLAAAREHFTRALGVAPADPRARRALAALANRAGAP
jgi:Flp pilus assembly protein TadD